MLKVDNMSNKTYFITGGEGFIGYHICRELEENGESEKIITYDAQKHFIPLTKSEWPFYQRHRTEKLNQWGVDVIRGDTTNRGLLKEKLEKNEPDIIIHLAALPIANVSNKYSEEAKKDILDGIVTLLDVLKDVTFDFERVVYTSSSMVYGDFNRDEESNIIPAKEDQKCDPLGIYGAMKYSGEVVTRTYNHRFGIPYTIIRPSAVYGPTDCNKRVTEIFMENAFKGKKLRLDNGGHHKLDFSYVKDTAKGFIQAANSKKAENETFNITRGEGRSIRELAEVIQDYIPSTEMYTEERDVYRPNRGALDISKAKEYFNYNPQYSLEKGIKEYVKFIKQIEPPYLNSEE